MSPASPSPASPAPARAPRALVAEDDPAIRHMMAKALRADGFTVVEVPNGRVLLESLANLLLYGTSPDTALDLIVVDLHMPHIDGLHVVAALRGAEWRVPVLVVTADTRPDVGTMARRMGARAVLQKPFDLDDFRTAAMFYSRCA